MGKYGCLFNAQMSEYIDVVILIPSVTVNSNLLLGIIGYLKS